MGKILRTGLCKEKSLKLLKARFKDMRVTVKCTDGLFEWDGVAYMDNKRFIATTQRRCAKSITDGFKNYNKGAKAKEKIRKGKKAKDCFNNYVINGFKTKRETAY